MIAGRGPRLGLVALGVALFVVLATANAGGYRFGVSDQAFYEPAIRVQMDPSLFPHDTPLLEAQTRLMASDKIIGAAARVLHLPLQPLFLGIYVASLTLLGVAALAVARALGLSWLMSSALLLALTLRHRIPKTGANTLEGYMHTRQLAFALGALGIAALLRRRYGWLAIAVGAAMLVHPTTGFWFALCLVPALYLAEPSWRKALLGFGVVGVALALWAVTAGPLADRLRVMDGAWLKVLEDKDYLFPTGWPLYAWLANLPYAPFAWFVYRRRVAVGASVANEGALIAGMNVLLLVFLISVPFTAAHIALAVQLQVTRVFWVMDFVATVYLVWFVATGAGWADAPIRRWLPAAALVLFGLASVGRGDFIMRDQGVRRPLVQLDLPPTPWVDAMRWLRAQPAGWNVLADPGHAWKYGFSVRVAAERDTMLESIKDSALAMYDRDVAMRVADRSQALESFGDMNAAALRALRTAYQLDVVIVQEPRTVDLPVLYRNSEFTIYDLR